MKKIISIIVIGLLSFKAQAEINIAVIAPQSGAYEQFGREIVSGVRLGTEEINAGGGLLGEKINLITADDACDNRLAVSTAQMVAINTSQTDKISLIIGPYCPNALAEVADIYAKAKIFQIIPTTISSYDAPKNYKGLIKMVGYKEHQAADFFKYYMEKFKGKSLALAYDGDVRSIVEVASDIQQEFRKAGLADKLKTYNIANYQDKEGIGKDILAQKLEMGYILSKTEDIVQIARYVKKENENFIIFLNRYHDNEYYVKKMKDLAEGSYFIGLASLKNSPDFAEELVKLRLLGVEPEGLSVYGYSAIKLWQNLVEKAKTFSYNKLAKTLSEQKVNAGWGDMMFINGNPTDSVNYSIYEYKNGEYTQVY